jgi:hypothetical protein
MRTTPTMKRLTYCFPLILLLLYATTIWAPTPSTIPGCWQSPGLVPSLKGGYQGNATLLSELELRWDFVQRWSAVFFTDVGKAFDEWSDFGSADWIESYGAGFRYLLARKFKLRVAMDIAHGPDTWAYYIVFGSNWLK